LGIEELLRKKTKCKNKKTKEKTGGAAEEVKRQEETQE
jgi:hypothetical protein